MDKYRFIPGTVKFLQNLGFRFHLGLDDELTIEPSEDTELPYPPEIIKSLKLYTGPIVREIKDQHAKSMCRFMGGPLDGKPHRMCDYWNNPLRGFNIKRACWAVYEVQKDGRAIFRGYATSKKKAKNGEIASFTEKEG